LAIDSPPPATDPLTPTLVAAESESPPSPPSLRGPNGPPISQGARGANGHPNSQGVRGANGHPISQGVRGANGHPIRWVTAPRIGVAEQESMGADSLLLAQLLWNRGVRTLPEARAFLAPTAMSSFGDPFTMLGMGAAVECVTSAIKERRPIAVYGDYDVDGVAGAALLVDALRSVGAEVLVFVPHRVRDGYGLNGTALRALAEQGARVVITVDCGITANTEVDIAAELGLQVIVTDHHTVPAQLPSAAAVLNPHQADCQYPCKELAGGGVAFQLARAVFSRLLPAAECDERALRLTDLAALSTIADVVPLVGENRMLASLGIATVRQGVRPGLKALCAVAGRQPAQLRIRDLSFGLIPRLNAAGRMGEARDALDLLLSTDELSAQQLAASLDETNQNRRQLMDSMLTAVLDEAIEFDGEGGIVLDGPYPIGLAGLLASRLVDRWQVPTAVIQRGEAIVRGSARCPEGFDLIAILDSCADSLLQYGGHPRAAGFSLEAANIERFREAFTQCARTIQPDQVRERIASADAVLRLASVGAPLADLVERFDPTGEGNPSPVFMSRGVLISQETVGSGSVRLRIADGETVRGAIFFHPGVIPPNGTRVDLCYEVRRELWQGEQRIDLIVCDDGLTPVP
jgi:single-stranded-DNA-specific exonuclease